MASIFCALTELFFDLPMLGDVFHRRDGVKQAFGPPLSAVGR
jgi:hypothetical protein